MLRNMLLVGSAAEVDVPIPVPGLEGKVDLSSAVPLGPDLWSEFWGDWVYPRISFPDDSGDVSACDTVNVPIYPLEMGPRSRGSTWARGG